MSWKSLTLQCSWIEKVYKKGQNFQAICVICDERFEYVDIEQFMKHMHINHQNICDYEITYNADKDVKQEWRYFKLTERQNVKCISCGEISDIVIQDRKQLLIYLNNHLKIHAIPNEANMLWNWKWAWKYFTKDRGDSVKCNLCEINIDLTFHAPNLKRHITSEHREYWKALNSVNRDSERMNSWNFQSQNTQNKWLDKCFTIMPNFQASCKTCAKVMLYVTITKLRGHILSVHKNIYYFEKERKHHKCFKLLKTEEVKCIICNVKLSDKLLIESHRKNCNSISTFVKNLHWSWKYMQEEIYEMRL